MDMRVPAVLAALALVAACGGEPADQPARPSGAATTSSAPPSCARTTLDGLDLAARAGQTLMIGIVTDDPSPDLGLVTDSRVGGIFLHGNSRRPVASVRRTTDGLQAASRVPLLIATDQEGGDVQRLQGDGFPRLPDAAAQGAWPAARLASTWARQATALQDAGITMNLGPVADAVPTGQGANPPIGDYDRQYGSTGAGAGSRVAAVVRAQQAHGVASTLKHFPGLGRVHVNTDTRPDAVDPVTGPDSETLQAFVQGWEAGASAVMVSSATYPKIDPDARALFSKPLVTGLLREKLGFGGLVMTDDVGVAEAVQGVPLGQRAVRFVRAGGDLTLSIQPEDAAPLREGLIAEAQADPAFRTLLDAAALRVLEAKSGVGLLTC